MDGVLSRKFSETGKSSGSALSFLVTCQVICLPLQKCK